MARFLLIFLTCLLPPVLGMAAWQFAAWRLEVNEAATQPAAVVVAEVQVAELVVPDPVVVRAALDQPPAPATSTSQPSTSDSDYDEYAEADDAPDFGLVRSPEKGGGPGIIKLYHVDINLGADPANMDQLAGSGLKQSAGVYRVKDALCVVQLAYETADNKNATSLNKSQSIPHVTLDPVSTSGVSISGGTATVHISGRIDDKIAGLMQTPVMSSVHVLDGGKPVGQVSLSVQSDGASDFAPYAKHFTFSGSVQIQATPGNHEMELVTDANEMGVTGGARFSVQLEASYPNPMITNRTSIAVVTVPTPTVPGVLTLTLPSGSLLGSSTVVTVSETAPGAGTYVDGSGVYAVTWVTPAALDLATPDTLVVQMLKNGSLLVDADGFQSQQLDLTETGVNSLIFVSDQVSVVPLSAPTTTAYAIDIGSGLSATQVNQITLALPEHIAGAGASPVVLTETAVGSRVFAGIAGTTPVGATFNGATAGSSIQVDVSISGTPVVSSAFVQVGSTSKYSYQTTLVSGGSVVRVVSASNGEADSGVDAWTPYRIRFSAPSSLLDTMATNTTWYHNGVQVSLVRKDGDYYVGGDQPAVMADPVIIPPKVPGDPVVPGTTPTPAPPQPAPVVGGDLTYSGTVTGSGGSFVVSVTVKRSAFAGAPVDTLEVYVNVVADAAGKKSATADCDVVVRYLPPKLDGVQPGSYAGSLSIKKEIAAAANMVGQPAGAGGIAVAAPDPRGVLSDDVKAWDVVQATDGVTSWVWNPNDNQVLPPPVLWTIPNVSSAPTNGYSLGQSIQIALLGQSIQIDDTTNHKQRTIIDAITVFVGQGGIPALTTPQAKQFYSDAMAYVQVYDTADQIPAGSSYRVGDVRKEFRDDNGNLDINKLVGHFNVTQDQGYQARVAAGIAAARDMGWKFDGKRLEGPQVYLQTLSFMGQLSDPLMWCGYLAGGAGIALPAAEGVTWAAVAWESGFLMVDVCPVGRLFGKGKAIFRKVAGLPDHKAPAAIAGIAGKTSPWRVIDEVVDPSVIRQLNREACGPTCGAMLLRGKGTVAFQSALALRQGSALTSSTTALAKAMNQLEGATAWTSRDGVIHQVLTDPVGIFNTFARNGSFMTSLRTSGMAVSHMVVVDGKDALGRVVIRDPSEGTRYLMEWSEYIKVWEGQVIWRIIP